LRPAVSVHAPPPARRPQLLSNSFHACKHLSSVCSRVYSTQQMQLEVTTKVTMKRGMTNLTLRRLRGASIEEGSQILAQHSNCRDLQFNINFSPRQCFQPWHEPTLPIQSCTDALSQFSLHGTIVS
jgi:hypothetical protein